ncbi:MAG: PEP-CTERM sorting domain-containing protein [Planctomycetota bacterium]
MEKILTGRRIHPIRAGLIGRLAAICTALFAVTPVQAGMITAESFSNNSAANLSSGGTGIARSWQTGNTLGPVFNGGGVSSFSNQFISNNAIRVEQPDGPDVALTSPRTAAYDLLFTVDDPGNLGYHLVIDVALRGYATAQSDTGGTVTASAGSFSGRIDTDMSDGTDTLGTQIGDLTLFGASSNANSTSPFVNSLIARSDTYDAGTFSGTRMFGLRFTTSGSSNNVFLQNNVGGEAATRFGALPVDSAAAGAPPFQIAGYPGADGESAADHGHFVTVTTTTVPEPGSLSLLLVGALGLLRRCRA